MAMHLTSMVHGSGREREVHENHRHLQHQQHSRYYSPHSQQRIYGVPSSAPAAQYHPQAHPSEHHLQRHPQSPPSPPVEEQKPSLPSISTLLNTAASGEKANSETAGLSPRSQHQPSPRLRQEQQGAPHPSEARVESVPHSYGPAIVSHPSMTLPPTPPMHPDSVVDGNQSPSATSTQSANPYFMSQPINSMDPTQQRQSMPPMGPMKRQSVPPQPSMSPYNTSPYAQPPYASSPGATSTGSYYSPETHYNNVGMYGQRPLPSSYQPQAIPLPVPSDAANASSMWQHHHYISATSQSAFPQSQDRYICSTCNKAFSRPSSLRIHSHSHTGEKPYKCPQPGCEKAFSVRSNMKRHERGCHAAASATMTTT